MSDIQLAVRVEGLVKKFGDIVALDGIDFEVPTGIIFGLLGPNGAGKTTAIRILSTILQPDGGRAEVMGFDVRESPRAVRCRIGLAGQGAAVDPNLTGRENLELVGKLSQVPRQQAKKRASDLLDTFFLTDAADRPLRTYSGGMSRRLDVAAALVGTPPVIFLDEPTTGLDIQSRTGLWEGIRALVAGGTTVLLTTQYLEEADKLADRIAVIDMGKVVANDTAAGLKGRLANTIVEITLRSEDMAEQAAEIIKGRVEGEVTSSRGTVSVRSREGPDVLIEALKALEAQGYKPLKLAVHEPTLDDVFLTLTGKQARSEAEPKKPRKRRRSKGEARDA